MQQLISKNSLTYVFAMAMGLLEAAVVIYLRKIYYPDGFDFPIQPMEIEMIRVEIFREIATLLMLLSVAYFTGNHMLSRFGYFLINFGLWDLSYYAFLKVFLNWPVSLMDWDVLFLLPLVWVGPVLAPVILAGLMVVFGSFLVRTSSKTTLMPREVLMLVVGTLTCLFAFMSDAIQSFIQFDFASWQLFNYQFIPYRFDWFTFSLGTLFILLGVIWFKQRMNRQTKQLERAQWI